MFGLGFLTLAAIHFLPTIIAATRNSRSTLGIFLVNLLLSWTVVGWIVALIWACTSERRWYYVAVPNTRRW